MNKSDRGENRFERFAEAHEIRLDKAEVLAMVVLDLLILYKELAIEFSRIVYLTIDFVMYFTLD